jgi:hypothetical protein
MFMICYLQSGKNAGQSPNMETVRSFEAVMPVYQIARYQIRVFINISMCNVLCLTYTGG